MGNGAAYLCGSALLVPDRLLGTEGNCSMPRVLAAHSLLSLWRSCVLFCHLCNGEISHLLWHMSKSSASEPAIVPTMTSYVQLQPFP